ncbi:hypothetical protein BDW02DRAFT_583040 [Decorospora gaudefroyi]|uniref:Uncharacterized protein n=1 Tax=Decorospora gaudefroyi TaxID=184978 RepID=A0A6A5JZ04_9PLEO|nr:hypothetical protein BDW02DRAFT_583040 [Decorospora gaudefroyi]
MSVECERMVGEDSGRRKESTVCDADCSFPTSDCPRQQGRYGSSHAHSLQHSPPDRHSHLLAYPSATPKCYRMRKQTACNILAATAFSGRGAGGQSANVERPKHSSLHPYHHPGKAIWPVLGHPSANPRLLVPGRSGDTGHDCIASAAIRQSFSWTHSIRIPDLFPRHQQQAPDKLFSSKKKLVARASLPERVLARSTMAGCARAPVASDCCPSSLRHLSRPRGQGTSKPDGGVDFAFQPK